MEFLTISLIALGLAADCFVVALGCSICRKTLSFPQVGRVSLSFGVFQAVMPVLGWLAGLTVVNLVADYDHWVALALLGFVGGKMIWGAFRSEDDRNENADITKGWLLLTLSVATSIDALAVGLTFAFIKVNILAASLTIGIASFLITMLGFQLGKRANRLMGKRAEVIGGLILIGIGVKIVLEHTL
ncbi:MAG: manganese efflux pump [Chloroflexi bacterium]|nr:manganese efflux pump [Chloroflexota bacterium]